jgi:hypothetical protein
MEKMAILVHKETLAHLVHQEFLVHQDRKDHQEQ